MVAVTSNTTLFDMDVDILLDQALWPVGGEWTSAEEAKKARTVLNLLLIEMQNKNIPLSKIDFENINLVAGTSRYVLNTNIVNVLEATISTTPIDPKRITDIKIEPKSIQEFHVIPNKNMENRPNCYKVERLATGVVVTVWPVPNIITEGPYVLKMVVSRKVEDITAAYQKINLSTRYLPLLTAWLSYKLSMARVGTPEEVKNRLQAEYQAMYGDTVEEDREKVDFIVKLGGISGLSR